MKSKRIEHDTWLDLSEAAEYLGVHFTTLRRWADSGQITYIRTPGGRRRFALKALETFTQQMQRSSVQELAIMQPLQERAIDYARESVRGLPNENMLARIDSESRARMKGTGHRLMALLLQYNSRTDGGEAFLDEGKRIMHDYSQICLRAGLTLPDTVHMFLFFRRSILDAIHETGYLNGSEDYEGSRLYHRTTDFLDLLILELVSSYQAQISQ